MFYIKKHTSLSIISLLISCFLYIYVDYFLPREAFKTLVCCWFILFGTSYYLHSKSKLDLKKLFYIGIFFRLLLLGTTPPLSQDFNRFIWDGRLLIQGINPYLSTPKYFIENNLSPLHQAKLLFNAMGMLNASHYTNYPPVNQFCYLIAALFSSKSIIGSIVVLRLQIILADIGIFFIGKKILHLLHLPQKKILLYFLNPFIILELTGNLHFEGVMAFFLVSSLYFLIVNKWIWSSILLGISINVKLIPLLFLPVFVKFFFNNLNAEKETSSIKSTLKLFRNNKKGISIYLLFCFNAILVNIILFAPFLSGSFAENYSKTISLWFKSFEFNASIYYIIRWIGFQTVGWNIIGSVGKTLPLFVILGILIISFFRKNYKSKILLESLLFSISLYLILSTTVHPWYLTIPLLLSIFTRYRYLWVWTCIVIFSYNAYAHPEFKENLWLVALEYLITFGFFLYELVLIPKNERFKKSFVS